MRKKEWRKKALKEGKKGRKKGGRITKAKREKLRWILLDDNIWLNGIKKEGMKEQEDRGRRDSRRIRESRDEKREGGGIASMNGAAVKRWTVKEIPVPNKTREKKEPWKNI